MTYDYDLFVIGGGSGGVRAARVAAQAGVRVGLAEEYRYGGTCVIRGCVPKKLLVYASSYAEHFEDAAGFGWAVGDTDFNWAKLIAAKDAEIARLEGIYREHALKGNGVTTHDSRAVLKGPHEVFLQSENRSVTAKTILIATGGRPFVPEFPGSEYAVTSDELFHLDALPKRALVVGGGYIAVEFAGILNGLGAAVTLSYRGDKVLRGFDEDIRDALMDELGKKGMNLAMQSNVTAIDKQAEGFLVSFDTGAQQMVDQVIYATGRVPNSADMGLEEAGVELAANGAVKVDAFSQTSQPSIWAVGDVTDRVNLTPVAIREGMAFVDTVFRGTPTRPDHELIPTAVFSQPEIGTVGMSEAEARAAHKVEIYKAHFRPMVHTLSGRDEKMLMKLIVDQESRKVLGVHIMGHGAGELIQCVGIAVKMGATKEQFDATMAVHPTAAEELVTMREPVAKG